MSVRKDNDDNDDNDNDDDNLFDLRRVMNNNIASSTNFGEIVAIKP